MEFFRAQFTRIQTQLQGLSASQKMLTISLVAIMVMTMLWWSRWAAEPEMTPVLNQSLNTDEIGQITQILDTKDIPHNVIGDRVLVPADRKMEVLAELGFSQALPRNFDGAFDDMIKNSTWIDSPDKSDRMFLEAKQRTLSLVIQNFPGVGAAVVVIDPTDERRLDDTAVQPSAMVMITTRDGRANSRQLAESAADVVSGAQAGIERSRVNIIIDGVSIPVADRNADAMGAGGDGDILDNVQKAENFYADKIRKQYVFIRGLMASVTVKVNTASTVSNIHTVDGKNTVQIPTQTDEQTSESTAQQASSSTEAGAVPNVGAAIGGGGGGGGGSNTSESKTTYFADGSKEDKIIKQSPGDTTVVSASVRVPRSYFIQQCKNKNNGKDPDDTTLATFTDAELNQIRQDVKAMTEIKVDADVVVGTYNDDMPTEVAALPAATAATNFTNLLNSHVKEVAVGALAVLSLFMVSMMVRKSASPPPVVASVATGIVDHEQTLQVGEGIIGQVGEGNSTLDAVELDEEAVKAQQVVDQVTSLVESNPEAAANLVKRWLNRT